jgi:hypothetical protein
MYSRVPDTNIDTLVDFPLAHAVELVTTYRLGVVSGGGVTAVADCVKVPITTPVSLFTIAIVLAVVTVLKVYDCPAPLV